MAKRKRLSAPNPDATRAPETKSLSNAPMGVIPQRRAPIADVAGDAATVGALQAVAAELTAAKSQGRIVQALPLDAVDPNYLIRDRVTLDGDEMEVLKTSLKSRGQQTPIEVVEAATGRYGLISGFRRLHALRELSGAPDAPQTVLALVRQPGEASAAYTAMVEENEVRVGLSYFERANIVLRAVEAGVFPSEIAALKDLFAAASRAKRSKIKSFLPVVKSLGPHLVFPGAVSERLGLALSTQITRDPGFADRLKGQLRQALPKTSAEEANVISSAMAPGQATPKPKTEPKTQVLPSGVKVQHRPGDLRLRGDALTPEMVERVLDLLRNL